MILIGLAGRVRSGKNSLATYLQNILLEKYNITLIEVAFAGPLKRMCSEYFDLSISQLYGDKKEELDKRYYKQIKPYSMSQCESDELPNYCWTPREIMQAVGSFFRSIDYNFWVKALDKYITTNNLAHVIVTDARHINECEYIKKNGILIKIVREGAPKIHGMQHESETALDDKEDSYFDIVINNDGSLQDLQKAAENLADALMKLNKLKQQGGLV